MKRQLTVGTGHDMNDGIKHAHARRISLMKGGALYSYSYSTVQDSTGRGRYRQLREGTDPGQDGAVLQYSAVQPVLASQAAQSQTHRLTDSQ